MNAFIGLVLYELWQSLKQAIAVVLLAAAAVGYVYSRHKAGYGGEKPFPWRKTILILFLAGYLAVVGYATLSRLQGYGASGFSFHLFRAWREAWNHFSVTGWLNVLLNIVLFTPLGVLLPLIWKHFQKWNRMLAAGFGISLYVELMQYLTGRGIFDTDDLFANTLGAMIGYFLLMIVLAFREKRWRSLLCYCLLTSVPVGAVAGIFVAYSVQTYGNLPGAYTYRLSTTGVNWVLECELSDMERTVSIYKMDPPTQKEADALRDTFAEALGVEFERTDYYDESTMYMDQRGSSGWHNLTVQRLDGTYTYYEGWDSPLTPAETDRETIEALLEEFSIGVPSRAEFSYLHSGRHLFMADRILEGETMVDGTLSCVYNDEGIITEIHNTLITCTYYGEAAILSPREACEKLLSGKFTSENEGVLRADPVYIDSCTLSYTIDTKGFYQPVYLFALSAGNGEYAETVMIPALR